MKAATETCELIKVSARSTVPCGVWDLATDVYREETINALTMQVTGYVYGKRGQTAYASTHFREAQFPSWVPKWLQRRWTRFKTISVDATPMLVWPDATMPPPMGHGRRIMRVSVIRD